MNSVPGSEPVSPTMRRSRVLTTGFLAGFLAIIVVLVVTLFVGLANLRSVSETTEAVAQTQAVKASLEQLLLTLVDAETGERGFVITANASYLEHYDRARTEVSSNLAQVRTLTADNREQQADLDLLSAATETKLRELAEAVRQRRESGFAAAQAAVMDNVGKRIMDEVRVIVSRMEAREDSLLAVRRAQAVQSYFSARLSRILSTGVALLVVLALFIVTRRLGVERLRVTEAAERLKVTLASIGDAVIATDERGLVIRMNAVAEALTGWTEADAAGKRLEEIFVIIDEESRQPAENPIGKVLREEVVVGLANHTVLISKNGQEIPVEDSAAPITTADGHVAGVIMVFRDVTERRQVERARALAMEAERRARVEAEAAEERLRFALQAGRMGTWEWTIRTGEVMWSPGLEAIHGLAPGSFPGTVEAFEKEIYSADHDRVLKAMTDAVDQKRDHHIEYRIVRPDGAVRWVEGRGHLFMDAEGPHRMVGVCSDITERKHAEEKFRLAVEAAPAAMVLVDRDGIIRQINAQMAQLLGYTSAEIVGQSIEQLVPERFRDGHPRHRAGFLKSPGQRPMGSGRDLYALRKDGHEVPVEIGLSPIETADGPFVLAAITDITERKHTAALLKGAFESERTAKREAQRANQLKDQFLATVSHELRGPLNAVLGWAEVLRMGALDDALRKRALDAVIVNAKRQGQLIDDLLDVTRIVSGKMRVERTAVDLQAVVRGALDVIQPSAAAKLIRVETDIDESIGTFFGDATRLQQILWNLLANAVKFTPEAGAIDLSVRRAEHLVEISVTDTGKGIAPEFLPSVFEPFRQADSSTTRVHGGLGLGLSIVKNLVEAHGGTVGAESAGEGYGATFTVRLPFVAAYVEQEALRAPSAVAQLTVGPLCSLDGVTALVVDDDVDSRDLVAALLKGRGASVFTAATSAEALIVLQREPVDVLLADIAMPGEDGYELMGKVRALPSPSKAAIPAGALTSFSREADRQRALSEGFQMHLAKPIEFHPLVEAVARLTGRMAKL